MFLRIYLITVCFSQLTFSAHALVIEDERGKVEMTVPSDWKYEKNLLGLPHVFLTDEKPERTSLSLTLTGIEKLKLPVDVLKKNQSQYQEGRKEWANQREIKVERFFPYMDIETKQKIKMHEIGFEYSLKGFIYVEKSYYAECPNSFVHLKVIGRKTSPKISEADQIAKSLLCL